MKIETYNLSEILQFIIKITAYDNIGAFLSITGISLLAFSGIFAYRLISSNPNDVKGWQKFCVFFPGALGVILTIAGPALSLFYFGSQQAMLAEERKDTLSNLLKSKINTKDMLKRIHENQQVRWLIRIVPYDPNTQPELSIARLAQLQLGPSLQRYTFVSDYEELRGYTAAEAARRSGLSFQDGQKVSVIIFPLRTPRTIIPFNARGLLQVVDDVEKKYEQRCEIFCQ